MNSELLSYILKRILLMIPTLLGAKISIPLRNHGALHVLLRSLALLMNRPPSRLESREVQLVICCAYPSWQKPCKQC